MDNNYIQNGHQDSFDLQPANRRYKDRLFWLVFREKEDLLDLYNAINHTNYRNADDLMVTTLEDVKWRKAAARSAASAIVGRVLSVKGWAKTMPRM